MNRKRKNEDTELGRYWKWGNRGAFVGRVITKEDKKRDSG